MNPSLVIAEARKLIGTPYQHQGRMPGKYLDCVGVPIVVALALELGDFDSHDYRRYPNGQMLKLIEQVCSPIILQEGALLVFRISVDSQHCGLVSNLNRGLGLIHACDIAKRVVEDPLQPRWLKKASGCYGLPGINYG